MRNQQTGQPATLYGLRRSRRLVRRMNTPSLPTPARQCIDCGKPTNNTLQRCDTCKPKHGQRHRDRTAYYFTTEWKHLRTACLTRDYNQCVICTGLDRLTAHHVTPRKQGGKDTLDNLITLCYRCHGAIESGKPEHITRMNEAIKARQDAKA